MVRPKFEYIASAEQLTGYCERISSSSSIAFDTEFVSEDTYRPQLCLIQVAAGNDLAIIDPLAFDAIDPLWHLLAQPGHATIVHAGREEFRFCTAAIGRRPTNWFDTQLAAAFVGMEFPAAYNTLVSRLLGISLSKGETRTDWRRRPLSDRQLDYALQDVMYLGGLADQLGGMLDRMGRRAWFDEDSEHWQRQVESYDLEERWCRVSGISGLSRRSLAIVRELWRWRDAEARQRDRPPRLILRDDLVVELARRKSAETKAIRAVRGMERGNYRRLIPEIAAAVQRGLELPENACPSLSRRAPANSPQFALLGQFVNSVLGCVCRSAGLAPTLVGTIQDVRDLIAYHLSPNRDPDELPPLARGWRAEIVGQVIADVLAGKLAIRVAEPLDDQPLELVNVPASPSDNSPGRNSR